MGRAPMVSIVLSARDESARIGAAVESILAQTFAEWELIVVDDGSRDDTAAVVEALDDSRIRVLRRSPRGLATSLNEGISLARSPYVARQDADDRSLPDRLEVQLSFLRSRPDIAVAGSAWIEVGPDGRVVRPRTPFVPGRVNAILSHFNPLTHTSVMFRKDAFDRVGGYDETLRCAQDYDLWLRLDHAGETIWNLPETLVVRSMTGENIAAKRERALLRQELLIRWRDLRRRREAGLPVARDVWTLACRAPVLAAPIPLRRLRRRAHGEAP